MYDYSLRDIENAVKKDGIEKLKYLLDEGIIDSSNDQLGVNLFRMMETEEDKKWILKNIFYPNFSKEGVIPYGIMESFKMILKNYVSKILLVETNKVEYFKTHFSDEIKLFYSHIKINSEYRDAFLAQFLKILNPRFLFSIFGKDIISDLEKLFLRERSFSFEGGGSQVIDSRKYFIEFYSNCISTFEDATTLQEYLDLNLIQLKTETFDLLTDILFKLENIQEERITEKQNCFIFKETPGMDLFKKNIIYLYESIEKDLNENQKGRISFLLNRYSNLLNDLHLELLSYFVIEKNFHLKSVNRIILDTVENYLTTKSKPDNNVELLLQIISNDIETIEKEDICYKIFKVNDSVIDIYSHFGEGSNGRFKFTFHENDKNNKFEELNSQIVKFKITYGGVGKYSDYVKPVEKFILEQKEKLTI